MVLLEARVQLESQVALALKDHMDLPARTA
jgi:hypothetical protein